MSIAATNEQLALQGAIRDWAKRTGTLHLVRAQEQGGKPATGLAAATCMAMSRTTCWKASVLATKSVSQLTSTSTPILPPMWM